MKGGCVLTVYSSGIKELKCKFPPKCGVDNCKWKHSMLLHTALSAAREKVSHPHSAVDNAKRREDSEETQIKGSSYACGDSDVTKVSLPIVTIYVKGIGQDDYIQRNALLDSGSNRTFCSKDMIKQLGVKGKQTSLSLQTLNKGKETVAEEVSFEAMSTVGRRRKRQVVQLPKVYALSEFPALLGSVVPSADVNTFSDLNDLCIQNRKELDVPIIIGQDVPRALMPLEVRQSRDVELLWMDSEWTSRHSCHRN